MAVAAVYTPPEERGRGYATALVTALCRRVLAMGKAYVCLFVDDRNPISNHVYEKIGFRRAGTQEEWGLEERDLERRTVHDRRRGLHLFAGPRAF